MATIYIDNQPHQVADGQNLLQAVLALGLDLPYFCWHPALGSVGACRQCAVKLFKDENDARGRIVMACMTPAADGTRISIDDPDAADFRAAVIEWLMASHPHDCPICDEGGECHLQDMTVMTGHTYRRHRFRKRTFRNQDLGPLINHEMNRCITCYRCVRFYRDYAGGRDLVPLGSRDRTYFGRSRPGPLESPFSGNLVEVCPTGVFTDKPFKAHYTRKWDLSCAPTICVHCGLGCNTITGERYGTVRRVLNRYHGAVNGYFLCDRGRFGYAYLHHERLLRAPRLELPDGPAAPGGLASPDAPRLDPAGGFALPDAPRPDPEREGAAAEAALERFAATLRGSKGIAGIGSPRASLESNFALRALVGEARFSGGLAAPEAACAAAALEVLRAGVVRPVSLREVEQADAVLVLGEDVTGTAPRLELALRQAVRRRPLDERLPAMKCPEWDDAFARLITGAARGPLFIVTPAATALDRLATRTLRAAPADIARLGFAVARALDPRAPAAHDPGAEQTALAIEIAKALGEARRPLVVAGTGLGCPSILHAAGNIARALSYRQSAAGVFLAVPECNTLGAAILGPRSVQEIQVLLEAGHISTLIVLENDLDRRIGASAAERLFRAARNVIVIDSLATPAVARAQVALPAATFAEAAGSYLNNEGRLQRSYPPCVAPAGVRAGWRWLAEAAGRSGRGVTWASLEEVASAIGAALPELAGLASAAPAGDARWLGRQVPRQAHRASGRTALGAHLGVSEPKPPEDGETPLGFTMEGYPLQPPAALVPRYWAPGWNSVQSLNRFQEEIGGPLRGGDPGVRIFERRERAAAGQPAGAGAAGAGAAAAAGQPADADYATDIPPAFTRADRAPGELRQVPLYHVFGSEELSALAPAVAALAPAPYAALNARDARALGVAAGEWVELESGPRLVVTIRAELPDGVVGVPFGLPGLQDLPAVQCEAWVRLRAAGPAQAAAGPAAGAGAGASAGTEER